MCLRTLLPALFRKGCISYYCLFFLTFAVPWQETPAQCCSPRKRHALIMNWIILIIAGLCEVGFTFCLGRAKGCEGTAWWAWMGGFAAFTCLSMYLLAKATQTLPLGTAYPVWTGIGAVGTVVMGIAVFHEPATFWRLFFITTLIASVIGLKLLS